MIEDPELRALFKVESEEHLQRLETGLLHMEVEPQDRAMLEEIFRSAHSLKGAAGMLGLDRLEMLAHRFEDELGAVRKGHIAMSAALADRLYGGLDAMRRLALEAGEGQEANVDVESVLERLRGPAAAPPEPAQEEQVRTTVPESVPIASPAEGSALETPEPEPELPARSEPPGRPERVGEASALNVTAAFKIDTIRVEPQKLDALMALAGEMSVTTARIERSLAVLDELRALWEEWGRDTAMRLRPGASSSALAEERGRQQMRAQDRVRLDRLGTLLGQLERTGQEEIARLGVVSNALDESIRQMRLLPFTTLFNLFPRMVRDLSQELGKEVRLEIEGGAVAADKHLLEELKDPLMHLLRNAIDHGIETADERMRQGKPTTATVRLRALHSGSSVLVEVADDGRGLDVEAIRWSALEKGLGAAEELAALAPEEVQRLIFRPGFSTSTIITDLSGRGVGLDVVRTNIERLKGSIAIESTPGQGCTFRLQAPITLATTHVLLLQAAQRIYALPVEAVQEIFPIDRGAQFMLEGRTAIRREEEALPVVRLAELLELPEEPVEAHSGRHERASEFLPCVLLRIGGERLGLIVEDLQEEQEILLKPFGGLLQRVRNVLGATVLATGEICMVLNPYDLLQSAQKRKEAPSTALAEPVAERKKVILLADDSITTRTQERRILESAGYEVVTAVDGMDAYNKLGAQLFDAVVSDVEMPNMDGLTLAERIRQEAKYRELPIILVTSLASDADRRRGAEVGANAYITKGTFDQTVLLNTLRRLV